MVVLTQRFLLLAALCAAITMPSLVLFTDARAVDSSARHLHEPSSVSHSASLTSDKGKGKSTSPSMLPLSASPRKNKTEGSEKRKKHKSKSKDGSKDKGLLGDVLGILARDPEHRHHHHHHHHDRRERHAQAVFNSKEREHHHHDHHDREVNDARYDVNEKRVVSRIFGKQSLKRAGEAAAGEQLLQIGKFQVGDGRNGAYSQTHPILKRDPHHHHHHHDDHEKVIVTGNNDDVHIHERTFRRHDGHHENHGNGNSNGGMNVGDGSQFKKRSSPHHDHHDHHDHEKIKVTGNNDDVHIHQRHVDPVAGCEGNCPDTPKLYQQKRLDSADNMPGVPGTVDIMNVSPTMKQRLASLVLSAVPDNSTVGSTFPSTKATADPDKSPFVLDASNSTQTQFYMVVSQPDADITASGTLEDTLAALKAASASEPDDGEPLSSDIKVTLQVPVFEPSEAAMRAYCATFDPNPPAPAPLTMEKCFAGLMSSDNSSDPSVHKSQTFAYDPDTMTIRPMWYTAGSGGPAGAGSSDSVSNPSNSSSNSTTGLDVKQMNFKVPNSVKDIPSAPLANVTQTVNGTVSSTPAGDAGSPQNVTLVFTPAAPAVHGVEGTSDVASFEPLGTGNTSGGDDSDSEENDASDSDGTAADNGSASATGDDSDSGSAETSTSSDYGDATTTDDSSATSTVDAPDAPTESAEQADVAPATSSESATWDATDVMSASASATQTSSSTYSTAGVEADSDAIEKMYGNVDC